MGTPARPDARVGLARRDLWSKHCIYACMEQRLHEASTNEGDTGRMKGVKMKERKGGGREGGRIGKETGEELTMLQHLLDSHPPPNIEDVEECI